MMMTEGGRGKKIHKKNEMRAVVFFTFSHAHDFMSSTFVALLSFTAKYIRAGEQPKGKKLISF